MIELYEGIWKKLHGAKQTPYDVSIPLHKLEREHNPDNINRIYKELADNLVHDGYIGSASLMALPHLVRIARDQNRFDAAMLKLCATIILQHGFKIVIKLPYGYLNCDTFYRSGEESLREMVTQRIGDSDLDAETFLYATACLAAVRQDIWLGKVLLNLDTTEKQVQYMDAAEPQDNWPERIIDDCEYAGGY